MKLTRGACVLVLGSALLAPVACSSTPSDRNDAGEDGVAGGSTGGEADAADGSSGPPPGLASCTIFPADNAWNRDVSGLPVHPLSDAYIDSIGRDDQVHPDFGTEWEGAPIGIPYVVVDSSTSEVAIDYQAYGDESDPGPFPIPLDAPVEGGASADNDGDRQRMLASSGI